MTSAADLEPALLVLPVDLVAVLLEFLADALDGDESVDVELCARAAALSLKLHAREVSAHAPLRRPLRWGGSHYSGRNKCRQLAAA